MNNTATAYQFDSEGYLVGTCLVNQNSKGVWAVPSDSTLKTPTFEGGTWCKFNGEDWVNEKIPSTARKAIKAKLKCITNDFSKHNLEKKAVIEALIAKDPEHFRAVVNNFVMSIEMIPEPTEEEKAEKLSEELIVRRNADLAKTDFYLMSDYPIYDGDLELIKAYRQQLRDLPQQEGFPYVEYPKFPF